MFGEPWGWPPADLDREDDQAELARHERENLAHMSFNYAVLDENETRLFGCVYIDPPERVGSDADISWWVVVDADAAPVADAIAAVVPQWIATEWPFEHPRFIPRDLTWREWLALPETGDTDDRSGAE
jgi:hypothetical protein